MGINDFFYVLAISEYIRFLKNKDQISLYIEIGEHKIGKWHKYKVIDLDILQTRKDISRLEILGILGMFSKDRFEVTYLKTRYFLQSISELHSGNSLRFYIRMTDKEYAQFDFSYKYKEEDKNANIQIVATQNGYFHADEITAIALLKTKYPNLKIIRTTDKIEIEKCDYAINVSGKYCEKTKRFDSHQENYKGYKSSAGMILDYIGKDFFKPEIRKYVHELDLHYKGEKISNHRFIRLIESMNPSNLKDNKITDEKFNEAILTLSKHL